MRRMIGIAGRSGGFTVAKKGVLSRSEGVGRANIEFPSAGDALTRANNGVLRPNKVFSGTSDAFLSPNNHSSSLSKMFHGRNERLPFLYSGVFCSYQGCFASRWGFSFSLC